MRLVALFSCVIALTGCQAGVEGPSLAARPAEAIDPRLPVGSPEPAPGVLTIGDELATLEMRLAQAGRAFEQVSLAGFPTRGAAPGSERWTVGQEIIAKLERANEPAVLVLADVEALIANQIASGGWASPTDRQAASRLRDDARGTVAVQIEKIDRLAATLAR